MTAPRSNTPSSVRPRGGQRHVFSFEMSDLALVAGVTESKVRKDVSTGRLDLDDLKSVFDWIGCRRNQEKLDSCLPSEFKG